LDKIYKNTNRLSSLIDRLRLLIKLESKNQPLILRECDIAQLAKKVANNLKESYLSRDIVINIKNIPKVQVDVELFEIVLSNLIENALKYSSDEVIVEIDKNYIEIVDRGIGIDEKEIEKINKKYYRVSNNGWNNSLGIGLSIVDMIIKMHSFKLKIKSKPKQGSSFRVVFGSDLRHKS
jgi:signal transduction histidine kinase